MSGADLIEYRLDRLEKSDEKKIELLEKMNEKINKIIAERALEKQRERWIIGGIVFIGSIAVKLAGKYFGI